MFTSLTIIRLCPWCTTLGRKLRCEGEEITLILQEHNLLKRTAATHDRTLLSWAGGSGTVGEQVSSVVALCCVGEPGEEVHECHVGDTLTDGRPPFGDTLVPLWEDTANQWWAWVLCGPWSLLDQGLCFSHAMSSALQRMKRDSGLQRSVMKLIWAIDDGR